VSTGSVARSSSRRPPNRAMSGPDEALNAKVLSYLHNVPL
jgi:hypothetical protein